MSDEIGYWFGWRLKNPPGRIVINGPFYDHEVAIREREKSKAVDAEVTAGPFPARTEERARKLAEWEFGLCPHPGPEND